MKGKRLGRGLRNRKGRGYEAYGGLG
jgi:hypothetical protein